MKLYMVDYYLMNLGEFLEQNTFEHPTTAQIYASGPSVIVAKHLNLEGLKIAVGDMPWRASNLGPYDYWITNNTYFPLPWKKKHLKIMDKIRSKTFISTSCISNVSNKNELQCIVSDLNKMRESKPVIFYNTHHFTDFHSQCSNQSCNTLHNEFLPGPTLQELLANRFNLSEIGYEMGHATLNAIAMAILLNCNPIYIHGVELPASTRKYKHYRNLTRIIKVGFKMRVIIFFERVMPVLADKPSDFSGEVRRQLLDDFRRVGEIASTAGIQLYSTSKLSPLNDITGYKYFLPS